MDIIIVVVMLTAQKMAFVMDVQVVVPISIYRAAAEPVLEHVTLAQHVAQDSIEVDVVEQVQVLVRHVLTVDTEITTVVVQEPAQELVQLAQTVDMDYTTVDAQE